MSKKVLLTDRIKGLIAKHTDNSVDASTVSVYECIAINSLPVSKRGTLYQGAILDAQTMHEMAEYVNNGGSVPLHNLHDQDIALPVGRVFCCEVRTTFSGTTELRTLFYLPNSEVDLIAKLEANVVDEVSVGFLPKKIQCSKCGFDFLGSEATFENIWTLTCNNDHTIGEDGVHSKLSGLGQWMELSLVSKGAANNAKILSRTKQLMGEQEYNRLAASGVKPEATTLFTIATKEPKMDMQALILQLSQANGSVMLKDAEITSLKASVTALTAERDTLKARPIPDVADVQAKLTAAEAEAAAQKLLATSAVAFVRTEADRLAVAAGLAKPAETADFSTLAASIGASRAKLADLPTGGATQGTGTGTGTGTGAKLEASSASSFKTAR